MVALAVSRSIASLEWLNSGHFSPAHLFATSEPGVWYDPSDVANTNWLYNLLTYTEQFDNASWSKTRSSVVPNAVASPSGSLTGSKLVEDTSTGTHEFAKGISGLTAVVHTYAIYAKAAERTVLQLTFSGNGGSGFANYDLASGILGTVGNSATATITSVGNGWYRCTLTSGSAFTAGVCTFISGSQLVASSGRNTAYTGDGTSGLYLWGAQVEASSVATTYQPITTVDAGTIARFPQATLYQDSAGTTPVTAPAQPVGLMLDKSQGLVLGSELVTNGDFSSASDWTLGTGWTISGGVATATTSPGTLTQTIGITAGRTYSVSFTISNVVGLFRIRLGGSTSNVNATLANGNYTYTLVAEASNTDIALLFSTGGSGTVDNISVKLLPGNHATQSTSASRPTYGIVPATGRRNLLTYSEQFDNAAWAKSTATVSANSDVAPNGTITADQINNPGAAIITAPAVTLAAGISAVFSVWLRSATGSNQTVSLSIAGAGNTAFTVTPTWQRFSIVWASPSAGTWNGRIGNAEAYNVYAWGAQLETSSTATAYQKVVTAFEVTEAGVPSLSYLSFDGVDDFMVTPTITPGTDKVQVFAGVRSLSFAAESAIAELGAAQTSGEYRLVILSPSNYRFSSRGTTFVGANAGGYVAPIQNTLTGIGDISGDNVLLRVNGTQVAQTTTDQGTGNYLAYPMYLGRRGGTSLPFNGQMYGLITRFGANLNTSQLVSTEGWMNTKTRAY